MTSAFPGLEEVSEELYLDENLPGTKYPYQQRGYLTATSSNFTPMKLCVIKDGFFLWYSAEVMTEGFDTRPQGLIPLQNCTIYKVSDDTTGATFGISNPNLPGAQVKFQASSGERAQEWMDSCESAKKASLANGALGHALIEQLQNRDKRKDEELQAAVDKMKKNALDAKKALEAKQKILKRQAEQLRRHEQDMKLALAEKKSLEKKKKETEQKLKNLSKEEAKAQREKMKMEQSLDEVRNTLKRLEEVLLGGDERDNEKLSPGDKKYPIDRSEITKSIKFLKDFFGNEKNGKEKFVKKTPY